jgi:peptide deformylase
MTEIVQQDNKVLRRIAKEVKDPTSPKTKKLIEEMFKSLAKEDDGVALAAPQIGESLRVFVVSPNMPNATKTVYINPKIVVKSKDKKTLEEGCLSCRWLYGKTKRASRVEIEATDENGEKFRAKGKGLMAQIFQHETDHLDGILFVDHAKEVRELNPKDHE